MSNFTHLKPKKELDSYSYHEATDRTYLLGKIVEDGLSEHSVFKEHPELKTKLDQILSDLAELYQLTGSLMHMKCEEEENNI